ncbi:MAG: Trk system potassium transporter TrkA [Candidatus Porifericomitaceae bacterium WSBS_2022_MAG_OTU9]
MKIVIAGAGQLGQSLAANLVREKNDVTVIDTDAVLLQELGHRYDLRTIAGHASYPGILESAGCAGADMIIAVTQNDETNMLACQVAYTLFNVRTKIARLRSPEYINHPDLFAQEALPIDLIISPENLVTDHIRRLIRYPGALQVVDFADNSAQLVAVNCSPVSVIAGRTVRELREQLAGVDYRLVIIYRNGKAIIPNAATTLEANDEVYFVGSLTAIKRLFYTLHEREPPVRRIVIAGGGNIGMRLASKLEYKYQVKVIENNPARAQLLSENLNNVIVLTGSATDQELLLEEHIDNTDVFCSLTNSDEINVLSAMLAKRLGAAKCMALVNQRVLTQIIPHKTIDIMLSPHEATIGTLLTHIRKGDVVRVHSLHSGTAEAIEVIIHGDERSSKVANRKIADIAMPEGTIITAIVRDKEVLIAHHDTVIYSGDHVIMVIVDKKVMPQLEQLFQVAASYV